HFSSVLLPLPLRPTIPKNSPRNTSTLTSSTAWSTSNRRVRKGWSARSFSVWYCSCGSRKLFETWERLTAGATDALGRRITPEPASRTIALTAETVATDEGHLDRLDRHDRLDVRPSSLPKPGPAVICSRAAPDRD